MPRQKKKRHLCRSLGEALNQAKAMVATRNSSQNTKAQVRAATPRTQERRLPSLNLQALQIKRPVHNYNAAGIA